MNSRALWQDIPIKKQGIIFVISYYRITIASEQRYLQDIPKINNQIFVKNCGDDVDFKSSLLGDSR